MKWWFRDVFGFGSLRVQAILWTDAKSVQANGHEGIDQSDVMPHLPKDVLAALNETIALDWPVYVEGCRVGYAQCKAAVSSGNKHLERQQCEVAGPARNLQRELSGK